MAKLISFLIIVAALACCILGMCKIWYFAFGSLPLALIGLIGAVISNKKNYSRLGTLIFILGFSVFVLSAVTFFSCGVCVPMIEG